MSKHLKEWRNSTNATAKARKADGTRKPILMRCHRHLVKTGNLIGARMLLSILQGKELFITAGDKSGATNLFHPLWINGNVCVHITARGNWRIN